LAVSYSPVLSSLAGLENLEYVGNQLRLANLPNLTSLEGIQNVSTLYTVDILETGLTDLTYMPKGASLGGLHIQLNHALSSLTGLESLRTVSSLSIDYSSIVDLHGLEGLQTVSNGLSFAYNTQLVSLAGLDNLTSVGSFSFYANTQLAPCEISALEARLGMTCSWCHENYGEGTCGEP
jgi:hypothetical protein